MKKWIDYFKEHWGFSLIMIIVTLWAFADIVGSLLIGKAHISAWLRPKVNELWSMLQFSVTVSRVEVIFPWFLAIISFCYLFKYHLRNRGPHTDVSIHFKGTKEVVRFERSRGGLKEMASASVICGICRVHYIRLKSQRNQRCPRCGKSYGDNEMSFIIAEARSKWITGKPQTGYIKTGKSKN